MSCSKFDNLLLHKDQYVDYIIPFSSSTCRVNPIASIQTLPGKPITMARQTRRRDPQTAEAPDP